MKIFASPVFLRKESNPLYVGFEGEHDVIHPSVMWVCIYFVRVHVNNYIHVELNMLLGLLSIYAAMSECMTTPGNEREQARRHAPRHVSISDCIRGRKGLSIEAVPLHLRSPTMRA
jgi:hypothetical protein